MRFKFQKFITEQPGKIRYPKFQTSDYNSPSFESKREHAVAMICCQGHYSQGNDDTSGKAKCVKPNTWNECIYAIRQFCRITTSKPYIYAFYKLLWESGCLCKYRFAAKYMAGTGIQMWYLYRVTNSVISKSLIGKINSDSCSFVSKILDVVSCVIASR
jgi:hypothetical protein